MRFLADENFPGTAVEALTRAGHDVIWVGTISPGASDAEILKWAARESRIVLTFDKDFGQIAQAADLPASCGVILFRLPMPVATEIGVRLESLISKRSDWSGHFSVVEPERVRMRPLPKFNR
jgi:predicted nuclease of predicted toxin-antitoxin system